MITAEIAFAQVDPSVNRLLLLDQQSNDDSDYGRSILVARLFDKARGAKAIFEAVAILLPCIALTNFIGSVAMALTLTSPAFQHLGPIPSQYTCEGLDISPPLSWDGVPEGTQSLVLIVDDPDAPDPKAPKMVWVHWVVYNIPPQVENLPKDAGNAGLSPDLKMGMNDFKRTSYGGPCPPIGRHRYFHKLFALDTTLDLKNATKQQLEQAMKGHVLESTELIGTYRKGDE